MLEKPVYELYLPSSAPPQSDRHAAKKWLSGKVAEQVQKVQAAQPDGFVYKGTVMKAVPFRNGAALRAFFLRFTPSQVKSIPEPVFAEISKGFEPYTEEKKGRQAALDAAHKS